MEEFTPKQNRNRNRKKFKSYDRDKHTAKAPKRIGKRDKPFNTSRYVDKVLAEEADELREEVNELCKGWGEEDRFDTSAWIDDLHYDENDDEADSPDYENDYFFQELDYFDEDLHYDGDDDEADSA